MSTKSTRKGNVSLAILDDYAGIAPAFFAHITDIDITSFPDTLDPSNAPDHRKLIDRLKPFTIVCTMRERTPFPSSLLSNLTGLKLLLTTSARNAAIDVEACTKLNIAVAGTKRPQSPGVDSTTEHTWALLLSLAKAIPRDDVSIKSGAWQTGLSFGLAGKTLGLLGFGRLGAQTAFIAAAFGMKIMAWSSSLTAEAADARAAQFGLPSGAVKVAGSKAELFQESDVLSLHYVLSERSRNIVGAAELDLMKPTALFINTSRGPLVDERALLDVLKAGKIKGAALDVFWGEPLPQNSEWRSTAWGEEGRANVVLSPHMGYSEESTMRQWYKQQAENVERWLKNEEILCKFN